MQDHIYAYLLSFITVTVLLIYIMKLPYLVTANKELVNEYYGENYSQYLIFDFFSVGIYLALSLFAIDLLDVDHIVGQLILVCVVTVIISGSFYLYFINSAKSSSFFSRWFHGVKMNAILYDVLLLASTFAGYKWLLSQFRGKVLIE